MPIDVHLQDGSQTTGLGATHPDPTGAEVHSVKITEWFGWLGEGRVRISILHPQRQRPMKAAVVGPTGIRYPVEIDEVNVTSGELWPSPFTQPSTVVEITYQQRGERITDTIVDSAMVYRPYRAGSVFQRIEGQLYSRTIER